MTEPTAEYDEKKRTLFSQWEHVTYFLKRFSRVGYKADGEKDEDRSPKPLAESNVFSSEIKGWWTNQTPQQAQFSRHTIAIDLDVPTVLIPSSTPGHWHLYIDVEMPWDDYKAILKALADAGVLERGYVDASIERGHTALRLPWERKTHIETIPEEGPF